MTEFEYIQSAQAPAAIGPYSQAVAHGDMVFCSGQVPLIPGTKELKNESIEAATTQALQNLRAVLAAAGCHTDDVVKTGVFLTDLKEFAGMNKVYEEFFGRHRPARATVQVAALPAGARVEIDCIAMRRRS